MKASSLSRRYSRNNNELLTSICWGRRSCRHLLRCMFVLVVSFGWYQRIHTSAFLQVTGPIFDQKRFVHPDANFRKQMASFIKAQGENNDQHKRKFDDELKEKNTQQKDIIGKSSWDYQRQRFDVQSIIETLDRVESPTAMEEWMIEYRKTSNSTTAVWVSSWITHEQNYFLKYLQRRRAGHCIIRFIKDFDERHNFKENGTDRSRSTICDTNFDMVKVYTTALFALSSSMEESTLEKAWKILDQMDRNKIRPTELTLVALLQNIRNDPATVLQTVHRLEERYPNMICSADIYNKAISACRQSTGREKKIVSEMGVPSRVGKSKVNDQGWQIALQLMQRMQRKHRIKPTSKTYIALLEVLMAFGKIPMVRSVIQQWRNAKIDSEENDEDRIWTMAINACAIVGDYNQAIIFLRQMSKKPNLRQITMILKAFANAGEGQLALQALNAMTTSPEGRKQSTDTTSIHVPGYQEPLLLPRMDPDLVALNTVLSAVSGTGNHGEARRLFDRIQNGDFVDPALPGKVLSPDRNTYHIMLSGLTDPEFAKQIVKEMRLSRRHRHGAIPPDNVTYAHAIQVCHRARDPDMGSVNMLLDWAKDDMIKPTVFMYASAIWTAQKCRDLNRCLELYEEMKEAGCPNNEVSLNAMITALSNAEDGTRALEFFDTLKDQNLPISFNALKRLVAAIQSNSTSSAERKEKSLLHILNRMDTDDRRIKIGSPIFEALITLYGSKGDLDKALLIADKIVGCMNASCLRAILLAHAKSPEVRWSEAVEVLHTTVIMEGSPGSVDQIALGNTLLVCAKADQFEEGICLLQLYGTPASDLPSRAPRISVVSMNALIAACGRGGCPEMSMALLNEMYLRYGIRPDSRTYRSAVIACNQAQHTRIKYADETTRSFEDQGSDVEWWECAIGLLRRMKDEGLQPDVQTLSSAISACEAAGQWQRALGVLQTIIENETVGSSDNLLSMNLYCWNSAISACEKGGAWVEALDLYERMLEFDRFLPNVVTMNSLLEALDKNGQKELAQSKYKEAVRLGIVDPWRRTKDETGQTIIAIDLHRFSSAMAKAAIRNLLDTWLDENDITGGLTSDLVIITGKGLNSASGSVLQRTTTEVLREYGIEAKKDAVNSGRIVVDIESLLDCFGGRSW